MTRTFTQFESGWTAAERVLVAYLAIIATAVLAVGRHLVGWELVVVGHAAAIAALWGIGRRLRHLPRPLALLRRVGPLLLTGLFYRETGTLVDLIHHGARFDAQILRLEHALFGGDPSQSLHVALPSVAVSEILHLAYLAYFFLPIVPLVFTLRRADVTRADEVVTITSIAFFGCQLAFIAFPVIGPYHHFGPPVGLDGGWITSIAHDVVASGSSLGTAFPSSHVAVTIAVVIASFRVGRGSGLVASLVALPLTIATVYGGFHYAVDALAGIAWGGGLASLGVLVHRHSMRE